MMLEFTGNWLINFKLLFSKSHFIDCSACETACDGMHREFRTLSGVYHNHLLKMVNTMIFRSYHSGLFFKRLRDQSSTQLSFPKFFPCLGQVVIELQLLELLLRSTICVLFRVQAKPSLSHTCQDYKDQRIIGTNTIPNSTKEYSWPLDNKVLLTLIFCNKVCFSLETLYAKKILYVSPWILSIKF